MKLILYTYGDPSVGIDGDYVTIDFGTWKPDHQEKKNLADGLADYFETWFDSKVIREWERD